MTSWRPFCSLSYAALSRSQFCSDFLQNWWVGRKLSSAVCYLKSARSVGNFRQYGGPRFRKIIKMAAKNNFFKTKQVRCLYRLKLTCWLRIWWYLVDWMRHFRSKWQKLSKLKKNVKWQYFMSIFLLFFQLPCKTGIAVF